VGAQHHDGPAVGSPHAAKHRIAREDPRHAISGTVYVEEEFDEPRVPGHLQPTLFIGPPRQPNGPVLLEVMVEIIPPHVLHVFHVMPPVRKHVDRMEDQP
jgi:hypothetical protein